MTYTFHVYTTIFTGNDRVTKRERIYKRPGAALYKAVSLKRADPDMVVGIYKIDESGKLVSIDYISREQI